MILALNDDKKYESTYYSVIYMGFLGFEHELLFF